MKMSRAPAKKLFLENFDKNSQPLILFRQLKKMMSA